MICFKIDTTTHTVRQALGLFEDLLQHKVRITTLLNLSEVYIHSLHFQFLLLPENTQYVHVLTPTDNGDIAVFEIHHLVGIFHNRAGIGAKEELILTDTHHQRTLFAGSDDLIRVTLVEHGDGIGTYHLIECHLHGLQQRDVLLHHNIFYQLDQHLGIGLTDELHALLSQFLFDVGIVLDDAVVDDGQIMALGVMGMGIT